MSEGHFAENKYKNYEEKIKNCPDSAALDSRTS